MVNLRPATAEDRDAIHALLSDLGYADVKPAAFVRVFADLLVDDKRTLTVAEDAGKLVGYVCAARMPAMRLGGDQILIDELVVAAAARGKGVGTKLLESVRGLAKKVGACRIEVNTSRKRESYTRGFYRKHGFTEADSALLRS